MQLTIELEEKDYYKWYIYATSNNENHIKNRKRYVLKYSAIYLLIAIVFYFLNDIESTYIFLILSIGWYFIFPFFQKRNVKNHYKKCTKENYSNNLDKIVSYNINCDEIIYQKENYQSITKTKEVEKIVETEDAIYLILKNRNAFIIPFDKIQDKNQLINELKKELSSLNIKYEVNLANKWR